MITKKELELLNILSKKPLAKIKELSQILKADPRTIRRRLTKLKKDRSLLYVTAQVEYSTLSLLPVLIFFEIPFKSIFKVEKYCDKHPYTRYRVRCLGAFNGLYTLFSIPQGTLPFLIEFCDELKERKIIKDYVIYEVINRWYYSEFDFSFYNYETDVWNFSWDSWERDNIMNITKPKPLKKPLTSILHKITEKDLLILRELSIDSRRLRKDIAKKVNLPLYVLSRRIKFLEENGVIDKYRLVIGGRLARLFTTIFFICYCPVKVTQLFASAIQLLPFQATLLPTYRGFFLQISIPPLHLTELGTILQKYCEEVKVLWSDYASSMKYYFYPDPFLKGTWRADREFMVEEVLKDCK